MYHPHRGTVVISNVKTYGNHWSRQIVNKY